MVIMFSSTKLKSLDTRNIEYLQLSLPDIEALMFREATCPDIDLAVELAGIGER